MPRLCLPAAFVSVRQLCQVGQREGRNVMMKGRKRPHTQGRPGRAWSDGGGGEGAEADMPSRCETVPSQSQLGIQTHEPKVILSSMLYTHDNVWQAFDASTDSSCLSFTPETCRQTRPCVDMSPPSPPQQILRLTLQQFVWKSALAGCQGLVLLPPYWESVSSESPCDRLPTTAAFLLPRINVSSFHGQWGTVKVRRLDWYQAWT